MERGRSEAIIRNTYTKEAPRNHSLLHPEFLGVQEDSPPKTETTAPPDDRARSYETTKLLAGLGQTLLAFLFIVLLVLTGISANMEHWVHSVVGNPYGVLLGFAMLVGITEGALSFPLKWYSGYHLEHRYHLSNQSLGAWLWEGTKGASIGALIGAPILLALFWCLRTFGALWWLPVGTLLFVVSVVFARLAPIVILPLFYSFKPVEGALKEKVLRLCDRVGVRVAGVFTFDMSKNTRKANAAFTGIGKSKRIILGDTLVSAFPDDEIEAVFAHELGHYTMNHLWIMMAVGTASTFLGLFLTSLAYEKSVQWLQFAGIDTIAAMPLLALWLGLYSLVVSPVNNMLSRSHEFAADRYAVEMMGTGASFASALKRLASLNLADVAPHPLIEFLFHSHPSISRRLIAIGDPQ